MNVKVLTTAAVESLINHVLKQANQQHALLKPLSGKVISLQLQPITSPFYLVFSEYQLDLLTEYAGEAHCAMTITLSALPELRDSEKLTSLIKDGRLVIDGDAKLASQLSQLAHDIDIDWEGELAKLCGGFAAYHLISGGGSCANIWPRRLLLATNGQKAAWKPACSVRSLWKLPIFVIRWHPVRMNLWDYKCDWKN